jgi:hypothetical protein
MEPSHSLNEQSVRNSLGHYHELYGVFVVGEIASEVEWTLQIPADS